MEFKRYQSYKVEDFLEDGFFQKWAKGGDSKADTFWDTYISTYPQQDATVQEAKRLLQSVHQHFQSEVDQISTQQARDSFSKLSKHITPPKKTNNKRRLWLALSAASVILIIGFSINFYAQTKDLLKVYTTSNGEMLSIQLPDNSTVEINANSSLKFYPDKWKDKNKREVWLIGEAYFDVRKTKEETKFIVHANDVNIAVLGTQFNVRSRGDKSEIVLAEGKIELDVDDQKIAMVPGDYVSYSNADRMVESKKVKAADYIAWKNGMIVFNNSLMEVTNELETIFGVRFQIKNKALQNRQIQLSAPANNLKEVLETLKLMYPEEINIAQQGNQVTIY